MTLTEARQVARIIGTADNGCTNCVQDLADACNKAFPIYSFVHTKKRFWFKLPWPAPEERYPWGHSFVRVVPR